MRSIDEFAELFFQAFYWGWCHERKSVLGGVLDAWQAMDAIACMAPVSSFWLGSSMVGLARHETKARRSRTN